jgi:hypothetical protein
VDGLSRKEKKEYYAWKVDLEKMKAMEEEKRLAANSARVISTA